MAAGGDPAPPPLLPKGARPCRLPGQAAAPANGSASTLPVELPRRQRPPRAGGSGAAAAAARLQRRTSTAEAAQSVPAPRAATAPRPATPHELLLLLLRRRRRWWLLLVLVVTPGAAPAPRKPPPLAAASRRGGESATTAPPQQQPSRIRSRGGLRNAPPPLPFHKLARRYLGPKIGGLKILASPSAVRRTCNFTFHSPTLASVGEVADRKGYYEPLVQVYLGENAFAASAQRLDGSE
ncbi:translation initiation factor IF-2-like [Dermacentor silvarum]|uniref:translation initiation factor IF-2-like n=1 Tax=Dermacentor silvarum TaxID=543639 RepID=UPI00189A3D02|nr:translation initiation factor IF-2-like [Dermacentor silvarum]